MTRLYWIINSDLETKSPGLYIKYKSDIFRHLKMVGLQGLKVLCKAKCLKVWSLPGFVQSPFLMARCCWTISAWWTWGCQQQQQQEQWEVGTTLAMKRQLQTSHSYTSSLPSHFINKGTQQLREIRKKLDVLGKRLNWSY